MSSRDRQGQAALTPPHRDTPADPVRVMFVSSHAQLGGGEAYLRSIVEGLGREWTADLVSLHDGPFVSKLREGGHEVAVVDADGKSGAFAAAGQLRRRIRHTRPDVIHANGVKAAMVAGMATLGVGTPIVWVKIDFGWDGWPAALAASRCDQVVGISAAVHETFGARARRKTKVVYAGIPDYPDEPDRGRELLEDALGGPPAGPVITLSGRLCPGKGQVDLLRAAPSILARHPAATFVLIGVEDPFFPDFRDELDRLASELEVAGAVRHADLPGHSARDAVAIVSASDVLAVPSQRQPGGGWREGFGLVAVEAMHVGTPVVAYASGALPEVVDDCGLVVAEGDVAALAEGINRMLEDDELRHRCIDAGRMRARERFSLTRVVAEMAACYREAAAA